MSSIAYTYARTLRDFFKAGQEKSFFSFLEELKQLNKNFSPKEVNSFFLSPAISLEQKKQVLKKLFNSFECNKLICSFLFLLLDKKRWREFSSILAYLINMENEMKGVTSVEVESVRAIDPELKEKLIKKLEQFFKKKISLKEKFSSTNLIGGIKIRSGGLVFDDTLLFHLTQMENQIRRYAHDYTGK